MTIHANIIKFYEKQILGMKYHAIVYVIEDNEREIIH